MPSRPPVDALRGSLDLLVLKTLSLSPMHGWGISQRVQQISGGELEMNQGSLYPALQRLEKAGLITSEGCDRQQPAGPVLPPDRSGAACARQRGGELETLRYGARRRPAHHMRGLLRPPPFAVLLGARG